jgi:luciferase family oxidoreductase group 1
MALSDNFLANVRKMPDSLNELLHFLQNDYPSDHMFSKISASPVPATAPVPWILGTSAKSALLAAEKGTAYAFGHFMSEKNGPEIVNTYRKQFKAGKTQKQSEVIVAVSVICAETTEKAEELALPVILWRTQNAKGEGEFGVPDLEEAQLYFSKENRSQILHDAKNKMIIGNPSAVKQEIEKLQELYGADEIMLVTITHSYEDRVKSYELLAKEMISKEEG